MSNRAQRLVVVACTHSLLGEGIGKIVLIETGAAVTVVPAGDRLAVEAALAGDPAVVIFEGGQDLSERDLAQLVPRAVLIDVSTAMSTATEPPAPAVGLDRILLAIRRCSGIRRPAAPYKRPAPPRSPAPARPSA